MSLGQLISDVFLSCTHPTVTVGATGPAGASQRPTPTVYTTEYCFTAPAACPTAEWTATYTIREVRTSDPAAWTKPPVPPNFIGTVVTCDVCEHRIQTISCPVEQAIRTGSVEIHGNGITATPALAAATATGGAMGAAAATPGSGSTSGSDVAGSKSGGGAIVISMGGWSSVSGGDSPGPNSGSAAAAVVGSSSSLESSSSGSNLGLEPGSILPTISLPEPNTKSDAASSNYDTADAPSLRNSPVVVLGALAVALVTSQFLLM